MKSRASTKTWKIVFILLVACLALGQMGCPSDPPNPDGGTPDSRVPPPPPPPKVECTKGTACLVVTAGDVRGCEVLLSHEKTIPSASLTLGFHDDVIGTKLQSGKRLAIGFVARKNESLAGKEARFVVKLPEGVASLKIEKSICYDTKGAVLSKAKVTLEKP